MKSGLDISGIINSKIRLDDEKAEVFNERRHLHLMFYVLG